MNIATRIWMVMSFLILLLAINGEGNSISDFLGVLYIISTLVFIIYGRWETKGGDE